MTNKIKLGDVATLEIKEDRLDIKTSKSTLEIYKDGNIKVENVKVENGTDKEDIDELKTKIRRIEKHLNDLPFYIDNILAEYIPNQGQVKTVKESFKNQCEE